MHESKTPITLAAVRRICPGYRRAYAFILACGSIDSPFSDGIIYLLANFHHHSVFHPEMLYLLAANANIDHSFHHHTSPGKPYRYGGYCKSKWENENSKKTHTFNTRNHGLSSSSSFAVSQHQTRPKSRYGNAFDLLWQFFVSFLLSFPPFLLVSVIPLFATLRLRRWEKRFQ